MDTRQLTRPFRRRAVLKAGVAMAAASMNITMIAGFAGGGLLVAAAGPRTALVADAATFAVSAACIRLGVRARPPARPGQRPGAAVAMVAGSRTLRTMAGFGALAAFAMVPQALAVPYAARFLLSGRSCTEGGAKRTRSIARTSQPLAIGRGPRGRSFRSTRSSSACAAS